MNNSEIIKGKSVKKYLDRALKNGWKIAKRIDFANDQYNYHLVPVSGGEGYICMWCKGKNEFNARYNEERYTDLYSSYKGVTLYETGYVDTMN